MPRGSRRSRTAGPRPEAAHQCGRGEQRDKQNRKNQPGVAFHYSGSPGTLQRVPYRVCGDVPRVVLHEVFAMPPIDRIILQAPGSPVITRAARESATAGPFVRTSC